ncbi:hypothetical protein [Paraburkholderia hospita]|uniref:hypothetical protein n=1 Tax=Paraburkholderia hospita TaxID=169430 RepID=UPI000B34902B|nr:hypothetical protein [Paraburkholderia hospita]OUL70317.1 hypothetical protein CA603_49360 [Paraburkholderia hospita]
MNQTDQQWIENRIHAAVDDDFYLDRDEEKRIKEEAAAKGIAVREIELTVRSELDKLGAACERTLLEELDRLLHQFTDNDKRLDRKEERHALDKVLTPASGKKKGLDPRVAEEYASSFCRVNGVKRDSQKSRATLPVVAVGAVCVLAVVAAFAFLGKQSKKSQIETRIVDSSSAIVSDKDKAEIDDQIRRARHFVEQAQYTDPPEKSAKACLDVIRQLDPKSQYRGEEVHTIANGIVEHYLTLADKSHAVNDSAGVSRWLERAKLIGAESELIREKEREFGLLKANS